MNAIEVSNVTKVYRRYARKRQFATLKSALLSGSLIQDLQPEEMFPALQGVSFNVEAGLTYGIIGRNGSGKSTALKLVAGISKPTSGTVRVRGRISALVELGAGFHPEISGRENVFINGSAGAGRARLPGASTRSSSSPSCRSSTPVKTIRPMTCGWGSPWRSMSILGAAGGRTGWATKASPTSVGQVHEFITEGRSCSSHSLGLVEVSATASLVGCKAASGDRNGRWGPIEDVERTDERNSPP